MEPLSHYHKLQPVTHEELGRCIVATIFDPKIHTDLIPVWKEEDVEGGGYPHIPLNWSYIEDIYPLPVEENLCFGEILTDYRKPGKFAVLKVPKADPRGIEYGMSLTVVSLAPEEGYGYIYDLQWHAVSRATILADELLDYQIAVNRYHKDKVQPVLSFISPATQARLLPLLVQKFETQLRKSNGK
jgi:hypothetical protein